MMVYYILFIQEIKDTILDSKESSRFRNPLNWSTCKIEKTRTDPAGYKLTEPNTVICSSSENQTRQLPRLSCLVCLNSSYGPAIETEVNLPMSLLLSKLPILLMHIEQGCI